MSPRNQTRSRSCASGEERDARTEAEILFFEWFFRFRRSGKSDVSINQIASQRLR